MSKAKEEEEARQKTIKYKQRATSGRKHFCLAGSSRRTFELSFVCPLVHYLASSGGDVASSELMNSNSQAKPAESCESVSACCLLFKLSELGPRELSEECWIR